MKIIYEMALEENFSNIGIAKALTEDKLLSVNDLNEISQYIQVYCNAESFKEITHYKDKQTLQEGAK